MFKLKKIVLIIILLLYVGTGSASGDTSPGMMLSPGDYFYDAVLAIESAQYDLTGDLEERVNILCASSERMLLMIDKTRDPEEFGLLMDDFQERDEMLWSLWEGLDDADAGLVAAKVLESSEIRAQKLETFIENEMLPEKARAGMKKALANQEMALNKQQEAITKAQKAREKEQVSPGQPGSTPGQSGSTPGQSGSTPGQSGSTPGQSGSTPGQSGSTPGQSGSSPGQSGSSPGQSGSTPGQSD